MPNPEKIGKVMHEFKEGTLHSGSKHGPKVTSRNQALAIALSEAGMSRGGSATYRVMKKMRGKH